MESLFMGLLSFMSLVMGLVIFLPNVVRYSEKIMIDAPVEQVYDNIRLQEQLMQWSAWPAATGATCALENTDGTIGARTVFFNQGKRFGHQEVIALVPNQKISLTLVNSGPLKHEPYLDFVLQKLSETRTEVTLNFVNTYQRPFHVLAKFLGIVRWTRTLHIKDLEGLKMFSEMQQRDGVLRPAGSS